ncbi:TIGR03032 family protein [Nostoc sp. FACHB-152]|uniref:TIGR03032 family protein n=1 Tax=unclassified Nostoc TaxID=2593658 RepID=UPI001689BB0C|nr:MULTISPECIES: TIGR03032 family protein [unclassified Nostoc]MBD2448885.1 TIGR03032 family protein [Nostoc sp. FACHB-152]MBD2469786.1 TIGR03032 family protein [Nostoc sp. FACHB-145]
MIATPQHPIALQICASPDFVNWLQSQQISLAITTSQSSRLMLLGVNNQGQISGFERRFEQASGLYATPERIYLATKAQIWQLDNALASGQLHNGYDKLYIPRIGYTTGNLGIHDLAVETENNRIVFVSSLLNCLATVSDRYSCIPLWKPKFISNLINENHCYLNGLAMVEGKPRYVTAYSQSDVVNGWQQTWQNGGCVMDIQSDEIIATNLSMPHSSRFYQEKLWLLNSGTSELGYINIDSGKFQAIASCPGVLRGLAFVKDYAIVGLSKASDRTETECGLIVIDIKTGAIAHWLRLEGEVTEIFDIQILPEVRLPQVVGFLTDEINQLITLDPLSSLAQKNVESPPIKLAEEVENIPYAPLSTSDSQNWTGPELIWPSADSLYEEAFALQKQGQIKEAIAEYEKLLSQYPDYASAWYQLGIIREGQKETDKAILAYQKVIEINPNHAQAHNNLGILRVAAQDLDKSIKCFNAAIESKPDYAFAHNNLGLVLQMQGKLTKAASKFREALRITPEYAEAYLNLGIVLEAQNNLEGAIACFRSAIQYKPNYIKALNRLGVVLTMLATVGKGEVNEPKRIFERVLEMQPASAEAFTHLFYLKEMTCDWRSLQADLTRLWEQTIQELATGKQTTLNPFSSLNKPWDRKLLLQLAQSHGQQMSQQWQQLRQTLNFQHSRSWNSRLRIGYLSSDFRAHAMSHLITGIFRLHNRDNFEIFAYSSGVDDNSEYRQYISKTCEHFQDVANLSIEENARLIFDDKIDILIDLNGHTSGSRTPVLALKPAPIQVNFMGTPGTIGADFIDYIIGDSIVTPAAFADDFSENIVTLPHSYFFNDNQQPISSNHVTRLQYGLPESGVVFCCFNNHYKIEPTIFDVWMRILAKVPGSVLWLIARSAINEANLRREAQVRGISGDRLFFAPHEAKAEHLARHQLADLFLDTLYYNAHTGTCDALWAGLPVITCLGETFASRVAASMLMAIGLPELVTNSLEAYEKLAINLATYPDQLQQIKQKLVQNRSTYPLFDTPLYVRHLEQKYSQMWEVYASGQQQRAITVNA